ncbi:hypothetical protein D3C75_1091710 [compost metagenome]
MLLGHLSERLESLELFLAVWDSQLNALCTLSARVFHAPRLKRGKVQERDPPIRADVNYVPEEKE